MTADSDSSKQGKRVSAAQPRGRKRVNSASAHSAPGKSDAAPGGTRRFHADRLRALVGHPRSQLAQTVACCIVLLVTAWNSLDYISGALIGYDSGCFSAAALHMLQGETLYRDAVVHKPPVIFFLDLAAMWAGGVGISAIRVMERLFLCSGALLVFFMIFRAFGSRLFGLFGGLVFLLHFSHSTVLEGGNLSEEYATPFALGGMLCALFARESAGRRNLSLTFLAGCLFSLAALTKEPFISASVPWFLYLILIDVRNWRRMARTAALFVAGSLLPAAFFLIYFASRGAMTDMIDHFSFGMQYVGTYQKPAPLYERLWLNIEPAKEKVFLLTRLARLLFWAGVAGCVVLPFVRKYRWFPLLALSTFLMDFWGTGLSGKQYGHYYLEVVSSFVMVGVCGLAFLGYLCELVRLPRFLAFVPVLLVVFARDTSVWKEYGQRLALPAVAPQVTPIADYIRRNSSPDDTILSAEGMTTRFYVDCGRLSPTRFLIVDPAVFIDTYATTKEEKLETLRQEVSSHPPRFIVADSRATADTLKALGLVQWFTANYEQVPVREGEIFLFRRKS